MAPRVRAVLGSYLQVPVESVRPDDRPAEGLCLGDTGIDEPEAFLEQVSEATDVAIPESVAVQARTPAGHHPLPRPTSRAGLPTPWSDLIHNIDDSQATCGNL